MPFSCKLWRRLAWMALCLVFAENRASAQPFTTTHISLVRHVQRAEHTAAPPKSVLEFEPVDAWFSYGPANRVEAGFVPAPDPDRTNRNTDRFGAISDEIIVIGERQRREFALVKPRDELTGPQALDSFQPFVPFPGATCTYKDLCYDMSQPPLRATIPRLMSLLFGD